MNNNIQKIKILLNILETNNILHSVNTFESLFYDEPKIFGYYSIIKHPLLRLKQMGYLTHAKNVVCSGSSYTSRKLALLKCLSEVAERVSLYSYLPNKINKASYVKLTKQNKRALNPQVYLKKKEIINYEFGWVKGINLLNNQLTYLPAQLIYLNYQAINKEPKLSSIISNGAAGSFSQKGALLNGILEIIERDASMGVFLNKISVPHINLSKIDDIVLNKVINYFKNYYLDILILETTNDLAIPTYVSILYDHTLVKPTIAVGSKSSFNITSAIQGSIEEAFITRIFARLNYFKTTLNQQNSQQKNSNNPLVQRMLIWNNNRMLKSIDFLVKSSSPKKDVVNSKKIPINTQYNKLISIFKKKKLSLYAVNISLPFYQKINYYVYKVLSPDLQPFYLELSSNNQYHNLDRLKMIATHFNKSNFSINKAIHPFI